MCANFQYLKISTWKLKLGQKYDFLLANDHKHTTELAPKWLKDNKIGLFERPLKNLDLSPIRNLWERMKNENENLDTFCI